MPSWNKTEIEQSIRELTHAIESEPTSLQNHIARGNAWCKIHKWSKALADYNAAIRLDPNNPHGHANRGYAFAQQEEWGAAIEEFSKALKLKKSADTLVKRATAYGRLDMRQEAINDLLQAMRMDRSDPNVSYACGLYHQWEGNYQAAVRYYDQCIEEIASEVLAYWYRAECLVELGDYEEAVKSYRVYIERENPRSKWVNAARMKIRDLEQMRK